MRLCVFDRKLVICGSCSGRQFPRDAGNAEFGAVPMLGGHVPPARRVVADEDGTQSGDDPLVRQRFHPATELGLDGGQGCSAVHDRRSHEGS